jgi:hypothetical protein
VEQNKKQETQETQQKRLLVSLVSLVSQAKKARATKHTHNPEISRFFVPRARNTHTPPLFVVTRPNATWGLPRLAAGLVPLNWPVRRKKSDTLTKRKTAEPVLVTPRFALG